MKTESDLAGLRFRPAAVREIAHALKAGTELELVRAPDNQYDPNAIEVRLDGVMLGFIQRTVAAHLAPVIDAGERHQCVVKTESSNGPILAIEPA